MLAVARVLVNGGKGAASSLSRCWSRRDGKLPFAVISMAHLRTRADRQFWAIS